MFRASCINAKPYKEQGWEKKGGEHSFLNGCSFRGAGITVQKKNVNEHQENDARNGFCGCVEVCFGYRASMRSPIESRAGRTI